MLRDNCPLFKKHGAHGLVVALDLDDTLFSWRRFEEIGTPLPMVLARLEWLNERKYEIIIHTSRINSDHYDDAMEKQLALITETLAFHGLPAYEVWTGRGKPLACHYVDDKAWRTVSALVNELKYKEATGG